MDACFRIMSRDAVFHDSLSTNVGIFFTECHDVHNIEDVKLVEEVLKERNEM